MLGGTAANMTDMEMIIMREAVVDREVDAAGGTMGLASANDKNERHITVA
jgi:hypothetical protein